MLDQELADIFDYIVPEGRLAYLSSLKFLVYGGIWLLMMILL
jgi:hypothetical protein